jgi:hypothetical protein
MKLLLNYELPVVYLTNMVKDMDVTHVTFSNKNCDELDDVGDHLWCVKSSNDSN